MTTAPLSFELTARDPSGARAGLVHARHGTFATPAFMPVGTQATVKSMTTRDLLEAGAEIILANAYHLSLRPGAERIERLGGLNEFMAWPRPILTDSGGFQVLSLAPLRVVTDEGVRFRSHLDGSELFLTPEECLRIQCRLDSDVMMVLDECPPLPSPRPVVEAAVERTTRWAERSAAALETVGPGHGALFGIVQGGVDLELRERSARGVTALPFDGFALGGLAVGESPEATAQTIAACAPMLPQGKPRYVMGLGRPEDLVEAVFHGIDMFDCVLPTRNARNGSLFTPTGALSIKRAEFAEDVRPVDEACGCETCRHHSRAYLRHLFMADEILASRLNTMHNLHFLLELMRRMRAAITAGRLADFRAAFWDARSRPPPSERAGATPTSEA